MSDHTLVPDKIRDDSWRKRYRRLQTELTNAERRAGDYFESHADSAYLSITEVVANSGIGYGTIVRFCQKLGCKGFQEFKLLLAGDAAINAARSSGDSGLNEIDEVKTRLRAELTETLRLLDNENLYAAAESLNSCRSVMIVGVASSAPIVLSLAWKLCRIGINARSSTEGYIMAIQATLLGPDDILFAVSASGATKDILHATDIANSMGAKVIALTNFSSSPLSQKSSISLITSSSRDPLKAEIPSIIAGEAVAEILLDRLLCLAPERREHLISSSQVVSDRKI